MHKAIVEINKVPTSIETWGRWIEETPTEKNEDIILCIPGNPGVTSFYRKFLQTLYDKLQCPVWIIGHGGHQQLDSVINVPVVEGNEMLYTVQGQIDHKAEFFRKYVPAGTKVHLVGHSIGAYTCLHLLKKPEINKQVSKAYLLFPAIENMADTKNGQFLMNIIFYITWLIFFGAWIFTCLPEFIQTILLYIYLKVTGSPSFHIPSIKAIIHPEVLRNIFFMAYDEMEIVRELDPDLIELNREKIKLYYGATDNWGPVSYYNKLIQKFPGIDAEVCSRKFGHAFVLNSSENVGKMVAGWIEQNK